MTRCTLSALAILTVALVRTGGAGTQPAPRVATDRDDYSPGSRASISGVGFRPGENVRLQILRIDIADNELPEHQPWQVKANAMGAFKATWLVTSHEAGATLRLSAKGIASGLNAQRIFTDSAITPASGGGAIPADTYTGAYTPLTGPSITETIVGDISVGTLILTTPAGFIFDTNAPLPIITLAGDSNNKNINGLTNGETAALTVTTNAVAFTITSKSKGQTRNTLTYSNVRVRPIAGSPLASGNITNSGTSTFPNSTTNFGTLTEVAGGLTQLAVSGFPSPRTAGVAGSVSVTAQDQFGNTQTNYTGTIHFTSSDVLAILPADYTYVSGDIGTHTFTNGVTLKTLGTQSITATNLAAASSSGSQSGISVVPAAADHLAFATQPGGSLYGSLLSSQPVVVTKDAFGNNSTVGIGSSKIVTLTLSSGTGALTGTSSLDIGTAAGNGTATFTNLAVNAAGAGKQLTASAPGLSNALSGTFAISQATLTAGVTASNKIYDATTTAAIATRSLTGVLGSDSVTLTGGTTAFGTKAVGNGKTVNVTGLGLGGASAANYALASTTATTAANITAATVAVSGVTVNNKPYDGTTTASVSGGSLSGVIGGDAVTLGGTPSASFASKTVSNNKPVTATGYAISGPDSGNYTLVQPIGLTASITAAGLTVSGITANNKTYNGNTTATLNLGGAALSGVVSGDAVTLNTTSASGAFTTRTVGTAKAVNVSGLTITGADSGNYTLVQPGTTADITAKGLTVSGVTANDKSYDGNSSATLNIGTAALAGVVSGDSVTLDTSGASGAFANATAGIAKGVTVTGLTITGADSGNYSLTQPSTTASINRVGLAVSADNKSRAYGASNPPLTASYAGFVSGENAGVLSGVPQLSTIAGTNSPIGSYPIQITVGSLTSLNYSFSFITGSLVVGPYSLTVMADDKSRAYGTPNPGLSGTITGVQNADNITASYATAANATSAVGGYSIIASLNDPDGKLTNYSVTISNGTLTVGQAELSVTAADKSRTYGAVNPALTGTLTGVASGDNITASYATAADADSSIGGYSIVPSLNDPDGKLGNYSVTLNNGTLTITPALLVAAANNATRAYGAPNPNFAVTIWGYVNGDNASELGGALTFNTPAQPTSPPGSYPIVPSGLVSTNYSITYSNGTLTVTATNQAPVPAPIADAVILPEQPISFRVFASDPNGDAFTFSLDPGAPAGAGITNVTRLFPVPTNYTIFYWRPTRAQASTTNLISVRVTDNGGPAMSSAQTFTIVVQDYVEISIASTNVESGQSVTVPINLASSDGVTNLSFDLQWASGYLANPALTVTAPAITAATLVDQGTNLALAFQVAAGQVLQGTQQIAQLSFLAITNQYSAFLSLPIGAPTASKPEGSGYTNYIAPAARITVIEGQPLLRAFLADNSARELTLYGRLGRSYQLLYSTNLTLPIAWSVWSTYVQTNDAITIGVDSVNPTIFYRIYEP